jgi:hypothetical protein
MWMLITNASKLQYEIQQNVESLTRTGRRLSRNKGNLGVHGFLCFWLSLIGQGKGKGKFRRITGHDGPEGE